MVCNFKLGKCLQHVEISQLLFTNRNSSVDNNGHRERPFISRRQMQADPGRSLAGRAIRLVEQPPVERPESLLQSLEENPALSFQLPISRHSNGLNAVQQQPGQPQEIIEVSTINLCCIVNRSRKLLYKRRKDSASSDCDEQGSDADDDEESDGEELEEGDYYKAVKIGSINDVGLHVQRGSKYLLVSPYQSTIVDYYKNHAKSAATPPTGRSLKRPRADSNATTKTERKSLKKSQWIYPHEDFITKMLKNEDDTARGHCGLYKMVKIQNATKTCLRQLKRRQDIFVLFMPSQAATVSSGTNADDETDHPIHSRDLLSDTEPSTFTSPAPDPHISAKPKRKIINTICICELAKLKELMQRELVAKVLLRLTKQLRQAQVSMDINPGMKSSPAKLFHGENWKMPFDHDEQCAVDMPGWNFLENLKSVVSSLAPSEDSRWSPMKEFFTNNEIDYDFRYVPSSKEDYNFIVDAMLNCRLNLITMWRLAEYDTSSTDSNGSEAYANISFSSNSIVEQIKSLVKPCPAKWMFLTQQLDPYLIGRAADSKIVASMTKVVGEMQSEIAKSKARIRLLTAVFDMLNTFHNMSPLSENGSPPRNHLENLVRNQFGNRMSVPVLKADLESENAAVKLMETIVKSMKVGEQALNSICNVEDWSEVESDNTKIWQTMYSWARQNDAYD